MNIQQLPNKDSQRPSLNCPRVKPLWRHDSVKVLQPINSALWATYKSMPNNNFIFLLNISEIQPCDMISPHSRQDSRVYIPLELFQAPNFIGHHRVAVSTPAFS
jgi:hypothetical protein